MRNKVLTSLKFFDKYVERVHAASYLFLSMEDAPKLSKDATCTVSEFLGKPVLDLNYRDAEAFSDDVLLVTEWLNHIGGKKVVNDACITWTFDEEEFTIQLRLWTFKNDN